MLSSLSPYPPLFQFRPVPSLGHLLWGPPFKVQVTRLHALPPRFFLYQRKVVSGLATLVFLSVRAFFFNPYPPLSQHLNPFYPTRSASKTSLSIANTDWRFFMTVIGLPPALLESLYSSNGLGTTFPSLLDKLVTGGESSTASLSVLPNTYSGKRVELVSACVQPKTPFSATVGGSCPTATSWGDNSCGSASMGGARSSALDVGAIAGIVVGSVIFCALLIFFLLRLRCWRRDSKKKALSAKESVATAAEKTAGTASTVEAPTPSTLQSSEPSSTIAKGLSSERTVVLNPGFQGVVSSPNKSPLTDSPPPGFNGGGSSPNRSPYSDSLSPKKSRRVHRHLPSNWMECGPDAFGDFWYENIVTGFKQWEWPGDPPPRLSSTARELVQSVVPSPGTIQRCPQLALSPTTLRPQLESSPAISQKSTPTTPTTPSAVNGRLGDGLSSSPSAINVLPVLR